MRTYPTPSGASLPAGELTLHELAALHPTERDAALVELESQLVRSSSGKLVLVSIRLGGGRRSGHRRMA